MKKYHIEGYRDNEFTAFFNQIFPVDPEMVPLEIANFNKNNSVFGARTITFVVTQDCNLRCTYCYEHGKNKDSKMSLDVAKKAIDFLFEEYAKKDPYSPFVNEFTCKAIILDMMGGEPLLAFDVIKGLYEYFLNKCIELNHPWLDYHMLSIGTNGVLFMEEEIQNFIKKYKNHVSVGITLDGNKSLHDSCRIFPDGSGSYDIVIKSVKEHLKHHPDYSSKLTIAPENMDYMIDAIKHIMEIGMINLSANCVFENVWKKEDAKRFFKILKTLINIIAENKMYDSFHTTLFREDMGAPLEESDDNNWCGGTGAMLSIDNKGDIYPCVRYMPFTLNSKNPILRKPMVIGDIYNGFLTKSAHNAVINEFKVITRKSQSTETCFNCPIASGCAWCSGYNYDEFGTANKRATYICTTQKARVMANTILWNRFYDDIGDTERIKENYMPLEWAKELDMEEEWHEVQKIVDDRKERLKKIKEKELENTNVYLSMF